MALTARAGVSFCASPINWGADKPTKPSKRHRAGPKSKCVKRGRMIVRGGEYRGGWSLPAPCWGCPAAGGGPGTPLQSTPCRPCCTSQPCVQPRPRLRPTARPCGTTMLGPCSHVPCLPKTGAPGAGLGAHLCPRGRDSTQHELAQHTAVEGRKQRREGGKEGRRERGKEGRGRRGEQTGREQGCREQGGARAQSW